MKAQYFDGFYAIKAVTLFNTPTKKEPLQPGDQVFLLKNNNSFAGQDDFNTDAKVIGLLTDKNLDIDGVKKDHALQAAFAAMMVITEKADMQTMKPFLQAVAEGNTHVVVRRQSGPKATT